MRVLNRYPGLLMVMLLSTVQAQDIQADAESAPGQAQASAELAESVLPMEPDLAETSQSALPEAIEWLRQAKADTLVCPFRGRIDYQPGEIECGLIKVPENREVSGSRTIELLYVRIAATGKDEQDEAVDTRADPVIYLTGGPGVTVESYVRRLKDHRLVARRDLYILEQRGIGNSSDFCPFFFDRDRAAQIQANFEDAQRAFYDQAESCIASAQASGVDVTGYHTFENARDVKALRMALGLENWNVWGISYGSVLGQAYMKVDADGIRAAVIDAIVPLNLGELMRLPQWHAANLEQLFAACAKQPHCARVYAGLEQRYLGAIERMNRSPVGVEIEPSEIFPQGKAYFFADLVAGLPFSLWYEQKSHPALPAIIDGLTRVIESGDDQFFRALALASQEGGPDYDISMGMSVAVRCQDGYVDSQAEHAPEDFRQHPVLAGAFGHPTVIAEGPERCRRIGLAPRDPAEYAPLQTDLPVIVANGRWDPVTPVALAEAIMPGLDNGRLVVFPHAGHGPTRSIECAGDWLNAFFDDPTAEPDRQCVDEGEQEASYFAPYFRSTLVVDALNLRADHETRAKLHAGWGAASLLVVVLATLLLPLAWFGRRLNGHSLPYAGGSRGLVFLAATAGTAWFAGLGLATKATVDTTEAMLLFGLVPWAQWFAWLGPVSFLLGLLALSWTWRHRQAIGAGSRWGLLLSALATVSLAVFGLVWDLGPW